MYTGPLLRELLVHMEWADAAVWRAILKSDRARTDGVILEKVRHIHRTQQYFLKVWRGDNIEYTKFEGSLEDELKAARVFYAELHDAIPSMDGPLNKEMRLPWADYFAQRVGREKAAPTTFGETLMQVTTHSTYHRGQVNTRLREVGGEPPLVDYIAWLWLGRPDAEWPG